MARPALLSAQCSAVPLHGWAVIAVLLTGAAGAAQGQPVVRDVRERPTLPVEAPTRTIGSKSAPRTGEPCVTVDIAGHKAGHQECAAQELDAAAKSAQHRARATAHLVAPGVQSADVVTGVANQTATRQRMGNTYGVSVRPQRPRPVPIPPRAQQP